MVEESKPPDTAEDVPKQPPLEATLQTPPKERLKAVRMVLSEDDLNSEDQQARARGTTLCLN